MLMQLRKIGIASLKIEGRLKQPDYVKQTVSAYRLLLDSSPEDFQERISEARRMLSLGCGRRWSHGFFTKESTNNLIRHNVLGTAGLLCGKIDDLRENGFYLTANKRIFLGERVRVQSKSGDQGQAFTITKMFVNDQPARRALPGEKVFICCDRPVAKHGLLFKIGDSVGDYSARLAALPPHRISLDLNVRLTSQEIVIDVTNAPIKSFHHSLSLSSASNCPVSQENLESKFAISTSDSFKLGSFTSEICGDYFFPASELKALSRNFWDYVKQNLNPEMVLSNYSAALERFRHFYIAMKPNYVLPKLLTETVSLKPGNVKLANRKAVRANGVYDFNQQTSEVILPEFCPETKLDSLNKAIRAAINAGIRRFRVTSLYGIMLLKNVEADEIIASTPLPVCNSMAALELSRFGITRAMAHIEMERSAVESLRDKSVIPIELYRLGRPVLLITRAKIPAEGELSDGRSNQFFVQYDFRDGLTRLYSAKVYSVPRLPGVYDFYDLANANWNPREIDSFNFETGWV